MIGNKGLYINAEGKFYPCCWTGLRYAHNKNIFNYINMTTTLGEILDDPMWKKLFTDLLFLCIENKDIVNPGVQNPH